jgi:hypothetical protein
MSNYQVSNNHRNPVMDLFDAIRRKLQLRRMVERVTVNNQPRFYDESMAACKTMLKDSSYATLLSIVYEHLDDDR